MSDRQEKRKRDAVEGGEAHAASLEEEEELGRGRTEVRGRGVFTSSPPIWWRDDDVTRVLDKHHQSVRATNCFKVKDALKILKVGR